MTRLLAVAATLLLVACSMQPTPPVADPERAWAQHRERLQDLEQWRIRGRMALSTPDDSWQADLVWSQQQRDFRIQLIAPLGQGTLVLQGTPAGAELRSSEEPAPVRAADAESLLYRRTGLRMPVESLRYWVRGLPAPGGAPQLKLDPQGRLQSLQQFGWRVDFRRYRQVGDLALPDKVYLSGEGVDLRLVIRDWGTAG